MYQGDKGDDFIIQVLELRKKVDEILEELKKDEDIKKVIDEIQGAIVDKKR